MSDEKTTPDKPQDALCRKLYEKLSKAIDEKYLVKYNEDGKEFTGYNAQAAINRLNEVCGIENWDSDAYNVNQQVTNGGWAVSTSVTLEINYNGKTFNRVGMGACYAKKIENAHKGALTSAFKNACKYYGIGKELYEVNSGDDDIVVEEKTVIPPTASVLDKKILSCKSIVALKLLEKEVTADGSKEVYKLYNEIKIKLMKP